LPTTQSETYIYNTNNLISELPFANIDNANWLTPALIDTQNISNQSGLQIISDTGSSFSGMILGPVTFSGVNLI
jgi:hypothetical protein